MNSREIIATAVANTFRSKLRTTLTVLAIFVGAFTLTLTNAVGTGISNYIDNQLSGLGANDVMVVSQASAPAGFGANEDGPPQYDPNQAFVTGGMGMQFEAMTDADLAAIAAIPGVLDVEPVRFVAPDYIAYGEGTRYQISLSPGPVGDDLDLVAGDGFSAQGRRDPGGGPAGRARELILPVAYVAPLGFADARSAVGESVTLAVSDAFGNQHTVDATVVAVQQASLFAMGAVASPGLIEVLSQAQTSGLPAIVTSVYQGALAWFSPSASDPELADIKAQLTDLGMEGQTVADQLGTLQTVIDAIIGVLNAFAAIALIAAGFGIINTLLMSVQERTREIGLMKAMGMGSARIFALFSAEAVFIGFLGSAIGSVVAIALGTVISRVLANGPLSDLQGLSILAFSPLNVAGVIVLVMGIAFLAGTLPARSAARKDPIEALRYE